MCAAISAQEKLQAAMQHKIVPNQEYLLQGSVLDSSKDVLIHRLRGLADNVDEQVETFQDRERVLTLGPVSGQTLTLYVRQAMDVRPGMDQSDTPWTMRYIGQPELGDKSRPTVLRNSIDVGCTPNVLEFLSEMGFKQDYEFMCKGLMFRKGRMKILVYKVYKVNKTADNWEPLSMSHVVELSVLAPQGHDAVAEDVRNFAEQLKPLVQLEKTDYRRL
ncbi:mediator of RNA polymerase II transcription subunit 18-like isoform X1 [Amphibalanus amphitrite]|uniref:mediator of RNA polymerase II transcription subunit 18-like isoform X1 n=1 Tax=Amphibalanus amphitrite TaxID=1232801 RepID=UPI001C90BC20|nr:mediator of RNA polymerase II transcription subunit 18-like isoform X1 [Amphibalanus amphitrite]XP_043234258.1 mediator of RNA polymerase II transcription subunit 18-like isoform X1 [Amphibalanus amphitrite]